MNAYPRHYMLATAILLSLSWLLAACAAPLATPQTPSATALPPTSYVVAETAKESPSISTGGSAIVNDEPYDAVFFQNYGVNPFVDTEDDHLSTFAMDVDTASYTVARRYLHDGNLPDPDSVRVEEFINYFRQDYEPPEEGAFAIHLEGTPSPFGNERHWLLRVGLQGKEIKAEDRKDAKVQVDFNPEVVPCCTRGVVVAVRAMHTAWG